MIDKLNLTSHFRNAVLVVAVLGMFLPAAPEAAAQDRVVDLPVTGDLSQARIEIRNPTAEPITFLLGVDDQLFEHQQALLAHIQASDATSCDDLANAEAFNIPCAAFEKTSASLNHHIELTDQFTEESFSGTARWWASSPMLAINSFGFGTCGTQSYVLGKLWEALGYDVRLRDLNGHTVTEVYVDERWSLLDADLRGFFVNEGHVIGMDDLFANPELAAPLVASRSLGPRPGDYPSAGLEYYEHLVSASTGTWRDVKEIPVGADDWRDLTITLPPNARLILAEPETSRCLYPENADLAGDYGDVTDPPFQYAVMEVPAGTVAEIQNGLFPAVVTGDYCLDAVYVNGIVSTTNFNEIDQFRFSRRFAREFRNIQANTDLKIYYMLNSKFAVRADNQVRLHGEGVENLELAVLSESTGSGPAESPCIDPVRPPSSPLKAAATSFAYGDEKLAANLVDGKFVSRWTSAVLYTPKTQMVVLDFVTPRVIRGIRWAPDPQYGMLSPSSIVVQTSEDGRQLQEAVSVSGYEPLTVDWTQRDFTPRSARYVLLFLTPRPHFLVNKAYQVTLGEVEIIEGEAPAAKTKRAAAAAKP